MKTKFDLGDKVLVKRDANKIERTVLTVTCNPKEVIYGITSDEVDLEKKEIVKGVSYHKEDELIVSKKK